jgi:hypothetical protein
VIRRAHLEVDVGGATIIGAIRYRIAAQKTIGGKTGSTTRN